MSNSSIMGLLRETSDSFINTSLTHGPDTGAATTAAYEELVEAAQPLELGRIQGFKFPDLEVGKDNRRRRLVERALHVVPPLLYASGLEVDETLELLTHAGSTLEWRMPYRLIDGPRLVRRELSVELNELMKEYNLLGSGSLRGADPRERVAQLIESMPIRPIGRTTLRFARIARTKLKHGSYDL